jgi:hypothetical protein
VFSLVRSSESAHNPNTRQYQETRGNIGQYSGRIWSVKGPYFHMVYDKSIGGGGATRAGLATNLRDGSAKSNLAEPLFIGYRRTSPNPELY